MNALQCAYSVTFWLHMCLDPNLTERNEKENTNYAEQMHKILPKTEQNAPHMWRGF